MKDGIIIVGGCRHDRASLMRACFALAASEGVLVVIGNEPPLIDLEALIQQFEMPKLSVPEPFFPKESAHERRNRGQKWYRQFAKKRKRA